VNLSGHQVGKRASFSGKAKSVTIGNGKTATAQLNVVDVGNFPASSCKPTTAAGFKVFPPNQQSAKVVPYPFGACKSTKESFLSVTAVK
jgi:hypothetical protein